MKNESKEGFTMMACLIIAIVLFFLLSLAMTATYRQHVANKRLADEARSACAGK